VCCFFSRSFFVVWPGINEIALAREFHVYDSGTIPASRVVTTKGAIQPVLHVVEPFLQAA
jgi:hypothetical protein